MRGFTAQEADILRQAGFAEEEDTFTDYEAQILQQAGFGEGNVFEANIPGQPAPAYYAPTEQEVMQRGRPQEQYPGFAYTPRDVLGRVPEAARLRSEERTGRAGLETLGLVGGQAAGFATLVPGMGTVGGTAGGVIGRRIGDVAYGEREGATLGQDVLEMGIVSALPGIGSMIGKGAPGKAQALNWILSGGEPTKQTARLAASAIGDFSRETGRKILGAIESGQQFARAGAEAAQAAEARAAGKTFGAKGRIEPQRVISKLERVENEIAAASREGVSQGVKPSTASTGKSFPEMERYYDKVSKATEYISKNRKTLGLTDAEGKSVLSPSTVGELNEAVYLGERQIGENFDRILASKGKNTAVIDTSDIVKTLEDMSEDIVTRQIGGGGAEYAAKRAVSFGERNTITQAQETIAGINKRGTLPASYGDGSIAEVDKKIVDMLNEKIVNALGENLGPEFSHWKDIYSGFITIRKDVAHRAAIMDKRVPKGLIDYADIYNVGHIMSGTPSGVLKGLAGYGMKARMKYLNNPNTAIKNMFKKLDRLTEQRTNIMSNMLQEYRPPVIEYPGTTMPGMPKTWEEVYQGAGLQMPGRPQLALPPGRGGPPTIPMTQREIEMARRGIQPPTYRPTGPPEPSGAIPAPAAPTAKEMAARISKEDRERLLGPMYREASKTGFEDAYKVVDSATSGAEAYQGLKELGHTKAELKSIANYYNVPVVSSDSKDRIARKISEVAGSRATFDALLNLKLR